MLFSSSFQNVDLLMNLEHHIYRFQLVLLGKGDIMRELLLMIIGRNKRRFGKYSIYYSSSKQTIVQQ